MNKLLENCFYHYDKNDFNNLKIKVAQFNVVSNGANIVQDDIFHIIKNYARQNDTPLEILRYAIGDSDFCACTFLRDGRIFVLINAAIPLGKQIFAAAHELYHIRCYFEENDSYYSQRGSMLRASTIDESNGQIEDIKANAFAGLFLVPGETLRSQIRIYGIDINEIKRRDIYTLMDIFAVPYKAMVLRLYEEELIEKQAAESLLEISVEEITNDIQFCGIGKRWQKDTSDLLEFGSLKENLIVNENMGFVSESRIEEDRQSLREIIDMINRKQG